MKVANQLRRDIVHLSVNLNLNLVTPLIFYLLIGFEHYGWRHLAFLIPYSLWIYTLDDAIEERKFPLYLLPLIAISLFFQPLVTQLVLLGEVLINLKAIFKKESFILEQLEGPGNALIYVAPYLVPIGVYDLRLWLIIMAWCTGINALGHKISHLESSNKKLSAIWGFSLLTITGILVGKWDCWFTWMYLILALAFLPFVFIKKANFFYRKYVGYNLIWQSIMGPLGFIYLVTVML